MSVRKGMSIKNLALLVMLAGVLPLAILTSISIYYLQHHERLRHTDKELRVAATFVEHLLGPQFHDQIEGPHSIPTEKFDQIVGRYNELCKKLDLEYIWSLMEFEGEIVFTSSTSKDKQVENGLHAGFLDAHSNPELYEAVFQTMEIQYQDNVDEWGTIRAVLIPSRDIHGRKYLIGASKKTSNLRSIAPLLIRNTLIIALILVVPGFIFSSLLSKWLTRPILELAHAAEELGRGNFEAELTSSGRTLELNILAKAFTSMRNAFVESLQELDQVLNVVKQSPIQIYRVKANKEMTAEFLSENFKMMGYDIEDLLRGAIKWADLISSEDLKRIENAITDARTKGSDTYTSEIQIRWADGEYHWYKCWNQFIRDDRGEIISIQGIMTEISDLQEARERDKLHHNRLRALTQDLLQAEDRERRRLALTLHDDIGQMLAALNMKISVLGDSTDPEFIQALTPQIHELLSQIMETTKSLTWAISPPSLYEMDIGAGLERMAEELHDVFGIKTTVHAAGQHIILDKNTSAVIFRCTKELLVNIAKHAGVKEAEVGISHYGNKAHLIITDEGNGFDPDISDQSSKKSYGLFSIKERIEHLGGSVRIESSPGQGTKIMLIIPIDIDETLN